MKYLTLIIASVAIVLLQGCAGRPETRIFSEQERYQLSLESLSRQSLPYDDYVRQRAQLVRAHRAQTGEWVQVPASSSAHES